MEPAPNEELELEIELMRQVGRGDRQSFALLYDRLSGILFAAAFRILNQQQATEDLLQEVFLQIWEKAPLYDPQRGKPLTWALTLTRNRAIDRLRATQRRHRLQGEVESEAQTFEQFDDRTSLSAVLGQETQALVRTAIETLSSDQRQAIELAFFSYMTQAEIAEHLNQPLATVKARIRRGMLKLRDHLSR